MMLILAALKDEIKPILADMEVAETVNLRPSVIMRGTYLGKEVIVAHTGVGFERMQRAASFCIKEYGPELAVNVGYCGALSPSLSLADIFVAESVIHEKIGEAISTDNIGERMERISKVPGLKLQKGIALTVDKVVETPHEKAYLGTKFGAIAVDMESYGLALTAQRLKTPFAICRSVLDPMDMHLPYFEGLVADDGTTNMLSLTTNFIRRPKKAWHLPQMQFCASKARATMMRFINELIKD